MAGKVIKHIVVEAIAGADFDCLQTVQNINLGKSNSGHAADCAALAYQYGIEPAATTLAPGYGAKFMSTLTQPLPNLVIKLCRKRATTHPCGVSLDDPQHEAGRIGAQPF